MSADQEQRLRILDNALWRIAHRGDCDYYDESDRPKPCDCPRCTALAALEASKSWRFHGALFERIHSGHWPREAKMHAAWMKLATSNSGGPDTLLSHILRDDHVPGARDWYVATSVIQWLATSVGMTVLEGAGFSYQQHEQDRADAELFRRRQEREQEKEKPVKTQDQGTSHTALIKGSAVCLRATGVLMTVQDCDAEGVSCNWFGIDEAGQRTGPHCRRFRYNEVELVRDGEVRA